MSRAGWMSVRRYLIVTLKYFFAVILSLSLAFLLDIPDYLSASFIAVLTLQPNLYRGIEFSWQQIKGTVLGVIVTVGIVGSTGAVLHSAYWPLQSAVAMGITIGFCLYLDLDEGTVIAVFTVAYLTCLPKMIDESFFRTLDLRFITIGVGLSVGLLLNYLTSLFGYWDRLYLNVRRSARTLSDRLDSLATTFRDKSEITRETVRNQLGDLQSFRRALNRVEIDLEEIEYRAPGMNDDETLKQEADYRREFETVYFLKDLSHHLWSLLLFLLKEKSTGDVDQRVTRELPVIADLYDRIYPGLLEEGHRDTGYDEVHSEISDRLDELKNEQAEELDQSIPVLGYFINCYDTLREGSEIVEASRSGSANG